MYNEQVFTQSWIMLKLVGETCCICTVNLCTYLVYDFSYSIVSSQYFLFVLRGTRIMITTFDWNFSNQFLVNYPEDLWKFLWNGNEVSPRCVRSHRGVRQSNLRQRNWIANVLISNIDLFALLLGRLYVCVRASDH